MSPSDSKVKTLKTARTDKIVISLAILVFASATVGLAGFPFVNSQKINRELFSASLSKNEDSSEYDRSIVKGSLVLMADNSQKKIEDVKAGDEVISYNTDTKTTEKDKVTEVLQGSHDEYLVFNNTLKTSLDHLIWTANSGFKPARDIQIGDFLLNFEGQEVKVAEMQYIQEKVETFDLIVEKNHNFFVNNYLVHNATITILSVKGTFRLKSAMKINAAPWTCGTDTVQDADLNTYNTVLIGTQCWMATNLMTTKYPSGAGITRGPEGATWDGLDNAYYAWPPNTDNNAEETLANIISNNLGFVYQWSAIMNGSATCNGTGASQPACTNPVQGICPTGWHIPSHYELVALERAVCALAPASDSCATDFLYDESTSGWKGTTEGDKLKKSGLSPEICAGATPPCGNSGFNGLLAGARGSDGSFTSRTLSGYFWSSTQSSSASAWRRILDDVSAATVYRGNTNKAIGFSVRCLKD